MLLLSLSFLLTAALDCDFASAFEKGVTDVETGSFGANLDRYCRWATAAQKKDFLENYQLGRDQGPLLKKAGIKKIPQSTEELDQFLKQARAYVATQEAIEKLRSTNSAAASPPEIQEILKRLENLEQENKKLTEALSKTEDLKPQ